MEAFKPMDQQVPFDNQLLINCEALDLSSHEEQKRRDLSKQFQDYLRIDSSILEHELDLLKYRLQDLKTEKDLGNDILNFGSTRK